ncbi:transmembrane and coiled-coil domain-containing protein 6 isoform X2 [Chiloscyllium plagiosum]|uniref:transmembrane and coiled-coil domain-containing protein 6 isoform X2 n=1 Tax=Chiloscyllium plagiosum TaxID=36176 RepID=UPI001CB7DB52|nr:transmembrane and coiled-coil domain-containing protein 6 isoform X2 [Chiloscyllium plagiosum]
MIRNRNRVCGVEEIKAKRRQHERALRKARKEKQLVSKRLPRGLQGEGEDVEIRETSVTREEVLQLYQRIQHGSDDRLAALHSLRRVLHLKEAQQIFVRFENSIRVLNGLFTSNLASVQLQAAQCLLELSHSDDPSVSLVCLPATPYLLTYLSGQSAKFTELCLYILGNLAAENEAVRSQLLVQGVIQALSVCLQSRYVNVKCLQSLICLFQSPHGAVVEATAYLLSQMLQAKEAGEKIILAVLEANLTPRLIRLLDLDSEFGMQTTVECAWCLHYIVSSGVSSECMISQGLISQAVKLLIALGRTVDSGTTDGVELLIYPVARCLGNLIASDERLWCKRQFHDGDLLQALSVFLRGFLQSRPFVTRECLWLLNNLSAGDRQFCSAILRHNLVPVFLQLIPFSGGINTLVLMLLGNVAELGLEYCENLQQQTGLFPALCTTLSTADPEVARMTLEVLNLIFSYCQQACARFANQNGILALEMVQYHSNDEVRLRANFLMDRYFADKI